MLFIEHIIEPQRLLLTWQAPDKKDRMRRLIAELLMKDGRVSLRYLKDSSEFKEAIGMGFEGYPAFSLEKDTYHDVLDVFMRRLPPRSRTDFNTYLESIRIKPNSTISDFALLGYAGARLPDDDFFIVHPFDNVNKECEALLMVQGLRHYEGAMQLIKSGELKIGTNVDLKKEPDNQYDNNSILVAYKGEKLGYICRGLLESVNGWIDSGRIKSVSIERINGEPEYRKVYIFLQVKGV
ncbi:MAG: HIRAN domain-containing protein [Candidatus Margulisiibacteriota bacterium]